jgi:hypothetical protein
MRWVLAAWCSDKYGQYGLVGCALCRLDGATADGATADDATADGAGGGEAAGGGATGDGATAAAPRAPTVVVECLNMSCRVLQRGVEVALLQAVARDARAAGVSHIAIPLIPSEGERKGNLLMRRFLDRLERWCCLNGEGGEPRPTVVAASQNDAVVVSPAGAPVVARHTKVSIGKQAGRRTLASALLVRVDEIQKLDLAVWLDTEVEGDSPDGSRSDTDPTDGDGLSAVARTAAGGEGQSKEDRKPLEEPQSPVCSAARKEIRPDEARTNSNTAHDTAGGPAEVQWEGLLDHAVYLASRVQAQPAA